ncbi:MAG: M36 family metallopeptidase, partial [Planctomycetaceae bacterium]
MRKSNVSFGRVLETNRSLLAFLKRGRKKRQNRMRDASHSTSALACTAEGLEDRLLLSAANYDDYQAYDLDQELGLNSDGYYYENWGGADERWVAGDENPWYFVTPNGKLHEWGGGTRVSMFEDSLVVATLDTRFYDNPELLTDAQPADYDFALTVTPRTTHSAEIAGGFLTGPTSGAPLDVAVDYLNANAASFGISTDDIANHAVTDQYVSTHNNVTHIYLNQTYNTLPIAGSMISVNLMDDGRILNAHSTFLPNLDTPTSTPQPTLTALDALDALATNYGWGYREQPMVVSAQSDTAQTTELSGAGLSAENINARLQYVPTADGGVELAWNVNLYDIGTDFWLDTHISAADGQILEVSDWVDNASYNVYALPGETPLDPDILDDPSDPNHPNFKPRTTLVDPQNALASPYGWHDTNGVAGAEYTDTRGNNVYAQEDRDADNAGGTRPDGTATLAFDFVMDLTLEPSTYEPALTTNRFYVNNSIHDILYYYGFDEAGGNFQENNYGRGGSEGDQVMADAVDGSGTNNANFATPPDGINPRMQMYEFTSTTPRRTSDLDNTIITHEYGHGISNRLTGGPSNSNALNASESRGMGEGWSDFYGLMLTQKTTDARPGTYPIGNYVLGADPTDKNGGIRSQPYSTDMSENTLTYNNVGTQVVPHGVGEVWCSVLWDLNWMMIEGDAGEGIAGYGFSPDFYSPLSGGNTLTLQLVTEGMKLQPSNPTMLDGRDAILAADLALTNGANHEAIWLTFARRGMGYSADDGGSAFNLNVTEAFDLPPFPTGEIFLDSDIYAAGDSVAILVRDSNVGSSTLNVTIESNGGDLETVTLTEVLNGKYTGSIDTKMGDFVTGDGTLQVLPSEILTATYNDADDGNGGTLVATDTANVLSFRTILNGDFSDASGTAFDDGFTHSGTGDLWHLSTGRGLHSGHSSDDSFYFGSGEGPNGGGKYLNNSKGVLTSPSVDLSSYTSPIFLDFNHFLNAESGFDFAEVRIQDNVAVTTTVLDGNLANTSGFENKAFDISAFAGQSDIQVEFSFTSDFFIEREGWYVDDVRIRTPQDFGLDLDDARISESGGQTKGTVSRSASGDLSLPMVVTLTNSDPTEATLPTSVTIEINETTARFTIDAEDDTLLDGTQTVLITATDGSEIADNSLIVTDYETITVTLDDAAISEN